MVVCLLFGFDCLVMVRWCVSLCGCCVGTICFAVCCFVLYLNACCRFFWCF